MGNNKGDGDSDSITCLTAYRAVYPCPVTCRACEQQSAICRTASTLSAKEVSCGGKQVSTRHGLIL